MAETVKEWSMRPAAIQFIWLCIALSLASPTAHAAQFAGGAGTAKDPYQIATAEQLISIGSDPNLLDKHFILTADIDLDPNLPGGRVFDKAIIGPDTVMDGSYGRGGPVFTGNPFTGVLDGNGHSISHQKILGADYVGLFGMLASGAEIVDLGVVDVNVSGSGYCVGGLVGESRGTVTRCWSSGVVAGGRWDTGGLVGLNRGRVTRCHNAGRISGHGGVGGLVGVNSDYGGTGSAVECYSTATVAGQTYVGGLIGENNGRSTFVTCCYSAGQVGGYSCVGGLVGGPGASHATFLQGVVSNCVWDTETSGQIDSTGGTGKTTAEMQTASTFLDAGWDLAGETANGTEDIWWINEGKHYPRLWWEAAGEPSP
jgi:hypothetical protein